MKIPWRKNHLTTTDMQLEEACALVDSLHRWTVVEKVKSFSLKKEPKTTLPSQRYDISLYNILLSWCYFWKISMHQVALYFLKHWGWYCQVNSAQMKEGKVFSFKKELEYISPFCGVTGPPVLDFWRNQLFICF